ncbi:MAG: flavodoxin-dependent (E)-4-hydroxy-3-methylbut-2-enyl-diphosphate synthase [Deltaproteobacteria bacterium]|nr:flavodoxin-dependent (E)-4-hydroxy-3-methylbut-2-enyl-diphosphate synthase [Deltaproteobacteria bacterium]
MGPNEKESPANVAEANPWPRRRSRRIRVGSVEVGGGAPVSVQSMTTTDTRDVETTASQIWALAASGADIVRVAVQDAEAADRLPEIRRAVKTPIIADIHFDYRLALRAIERGADAVRVNPGNIGARERLREIANAARERGVPLRIGVNGGSLSKAILARYGHPTAEAIVESAVETAAFLDDLGFHTFKIAVKSSDVVETIRAYRLLAPRGDWPLHIGVTEAGPEAPGTVRSAVGIGVVLADGIGDTLRVSLTADPVAEVRVGIDILKSLGLRRPGLTLVSCPSCGRCGIDLIGLTSRIEKRLASELAGSTADLRVAVMGCAVNGPGEAREADIGVAGGDGEALLFAKGRVVRKIAESEMEDVVVAEVKRLATPREER